MTQAQTAFVWVKDKAVFAITFAGELTNSSYGTCVAELPLDELPGVGTPWPVKADKKTKATA